MGCKFYRRTICYLNVLNLQIFCMKYMINICVWFTKALFMHLQRVSYIGFPCAHIVYCTTFSDLNTNDNMEVYFNSYSYCIATGTLVNPSSYKRPTCRPQKKKIERIVGVLKRQGLGTTVIKFLLATNYL